MLIKGLMPMPFHICLRLSGIYLSFNIYLVLTIYSTCFNILFSSLLILTPIHTPAGPPSRPEGPLEVSDVKANGCKLKWDKPEDDGGLPVDHYEVSV